MSKRFRDTGIWKKEWYRKLTPEQKCAWAYLCDECDNVGVLALDTEAANFLIGAAVDWEALVKSCNGNIEILEDGKWWLVDFCLFQHGDLFGRKQSSVLDSYMGLLQKHGLTERVKQRFGNSCQTVLGKGEGMGMGKGEGKGKGEEAERQKYAEGVRMTKAEHSALVAQYGERVVKVAIDKVAAQQIKTGKAYKSPRGAVLQWGIRAALEEIKKGGAPAAAGPACPECHVGGGNHGAFCSRKPA